jgi:glucose/mannose-6-phosphate isomerase
MMFDLISGFPGQLQEASEIGEKAFLTPAPLPILNVLITGLGGSGIGGKIISLLVEKEASVPITVNNKYFIPAYVGPQTLVIVSSYSGNTEETINCMEEALRKGAKITCVSSGGKITELAKENKLDLIELPGGLPPRSCLGYSMTQLLYILAFHGITNHGFKTNLSASINLINDEKTSIMMEAKAIAAKLVGRFPVIYSTSSSEGIAIRLRQQFNENAKTLCWHHVFPELNHNELVGWREKNENIAVIILRNSHDYERNQTRIEISKTVFSKYTPNIIEVFSKGESMLENAIYLIHIGDWISYFLAELKGVDPIEVKIIDFLKDELAKR